MRAMKGIVAASVLALGLPVLVVAQAQPGHQSWEAKSCADTWRPDADSPDFWRWQAYHNLDCAMAMIDQHVGQHDGRTAVSEGDIIQISREDLEQLRRLILVGKDGAMRIGR